MYINYESYKVFYKTAVCRSITAAAMEMGLTQPTVTHSIQKLEEALGCTLLLRGKKGVTLTPEGKIMFHYIEIACENISQAEKELKRYQNKESGELTIGASETTLHHFLLPYISEYRKTYPGICLKIYNNVAPAIQEQVEKGMLDCAIIFSHNCFGKENLMVKELTQLRYILIAGAERSNLKNRPVRLQELEPYPLIGLSENTVSGQAQRTYFEQNKTAFQPSLVLTTADLVVPVVSNNLGIGFVPEPFAKEALKDGKIFQIQVNEETPSRSICFICEKSRIHKPSVEALLSLLLK